jgi:hypothetical protein
MRRILYVSFVIASCAWAQAKPDFSGTWKLDPAASDYTDHGVVPDRLVRTLKQSGKTLRYKEEWAKGDRKNNFDIKLDIGGGPDESDAAGIVTVEWKDATLLVKILYNPGTDRQADQTEIWSLSADGKTITDQTVYRTVKGNEFHFKRVFEKQP